MPGQSGLDRNIKRFKIADFTNKDNVRVLAQDGTQRRCKRKADFRADIDLTNAFHLVFDGIFDSDNVFLRRINKFQDRIKGRRFAAPRRPAGENHAVGLQGAFFQRLQGLSAKTEFCDIKHR